MSDLSGDMPDGPGSASMKEPAQFADRRGADILPFYETPVRLHRARPATGYHRPALERHNTGSLHEHDESDRPAIQPR